MAIQLEKLEHPDHRWMQAQDFALINVMQVPQQARTDLVGQPLVPARHKTKAHLFPLLIELRHLSTQRRVALLDRAQSWHEREGRPYFGALLACSDEAGVLCRHLVKRADVRLPDGRRDVLRLHDPRVFSHLMWILRPEQISALLGSIRSWSWRDAQGGWCSLVHADARSAHRGLHFAIESEQWPHLQHMPDINAVSAHVPLAMAAQTDNLARRISDQLILAEQTFPQAVPADRRLYAEHVIRFGDQLYRHPVMRKRMAAVRAGKHGYLTAVADLDEADLINLSRVAVEHDMEPTLKESS